jgi:hypothetical protein
VARQLRSASAVRLAALVVAVGVSLLPTRARACGTEVGLFGGGAAKSSPDAQYWVFGQGGAAQGREGERSPYGPIFQAGVGGSLHEGGGFALGPTFSAIVRPTVATAPSSTDLALSLRGATLGFQHGFGAAFDLGAFTRVSGGRAFGPSGAATLGAPYGIQASFLFELPRGAPATQALLLGVDLARL